MKESVRLFTEKNVVNPTDDLTFMKESVRLFTEKNVVPLGTDPERFVKDLFDARQSFRGFKTSILPLSKNEWVAA
jgi:hypothetical protein